MTHAPDRPSRAFIGARLLCAGPLSKTALAAWRALAADPTAQALVFDDETGRVVDLDLRGGEAEVLSRLREGAPEAASPKRRGRPKLGVSAREVTLLPRHWDWLATQRGGASATLRRLVEAAQRRQAEEGDGGRAAREAAYRFMAAMAGDRPGFEEATRALFARDRAGLERESAAWPEAIRDFALRRAFDPPPWS